jgi:hypothetical protein
LFTSSPAAGQGISIRIMVASRYLQSVGKHNVLSPALRRADLVPKERPVLFFVEATIGTNLFFSSVSIERENGFGGSQYVNGDNSKGYWAFTWGPGIGVEIPLDKQRRVGAIIKGSYLMGARTIYHRPQH